MTRRALSGAASLAALLAAHAAAQDAPIVQPGAPGDAPRALSADEAARVADTSYAPADVHFMQMMIPHHGQAVVMARMAPERTNDEGVLEAAARIAASQGDEVAFMRGWLEDRGEPVPKALGPAAYGEHSGHADHAGHDVVDEAAMTAMGMASAKQLEELEASEGAAFDRLFLTLMITHHEGAIRMVEALHDTPGAAYDPTLYRFTNDVVADQSAEVTRMNAMLTGLSEDPRVGLAPGLDDAGQAAQGVRLVAHLPKPAGFFDPENRIGLMAVEPDTATPGRGAPEADDVEGGDVKTEYSERWPYLSFWNTDMAFSGDTLVAGNYHGFNAYRLGEDGVPSLAASVVCPGGQGDVSIVGDLLLMSVEQTRGRTDCGLQGVDADASPERFRGLRIFDVSDVTAPRQVGQVQTCRGSHTHTVVAADERRIVVYNSGTSGVRDEAELAGCKPGQPGDEDTALFSIDVIEIPVDRPSEAAITSSPRVFADDETGRIAGLWGGGDHGEGTQVTSRTDQCHDITVFPSKQLAAGACSGNGILLDVSDPLNPRRIAAVSDEGFAYWHSATFNNDGTKVLFTDEWGGGVMPRCRASDPKTWGADAIYEVTEEGLAFASYYKVPAPQTETENCVAHNGSVVPVPGRDVFAQAWYQGGLSVVDFTDAENPVEIASFDRGPLHEDEVVVGGYWSTYWYGGMIYGTEIVRGLDVLALEPSEHLTRNEIDAAALADMGEAFNPQQQVRVTWPDHPVVALAYLDQIERAGALPEGEVEALRDVLDAAKAAHEAGGRDRELARELRREARRLARAGGKQATLASTMEGVARALG